jgi:hypothetical protein
MRTFTAHIHDNRYARPAEAFIVAADELRARVLARRELSNWAGAVRVEVRENGRPLWTEAA